MKMSHIDDMEEFNEKIAEFDEERARVKLQKLRGVETVSDYPSLVPKTTEEAKVSAQMWAVYGGDRFSPCEYSEKILPPGQYTIEHSDSIGTHFHAVTTNLDGLLELPDSAAEAVIKEVKSFWNKEQHFRKFGFMWKRGIMLWGPPGSGKTVCVQQISQFVVKSGGVALYINTPSYDVKGLRLLRQIEPNRPLVIILEDIDSIIDTHGESSLLALLDGELQIDNVLFIATTNYPERLDKRFINRPSRFDLVKKIGMPSNEAREAYFRAKNSRLSHNPEELRTWVGDTKGFSIAHMKELIVSVEVFEVRYEEALARLKKMMDVKVSSVNNDESNFGFMNR
jgi:hypothetical protein